MTQNPLEKAIDRAGGVTALARKLEISHAAISQWKQVPSGRVLAVEDATGVSRYELRPDVFGPKPRGKRNA